MNTSAFVPPGDVGKNPNVAELSTTEIVGLLRSVSVSTPRVRNELASHRVEKAAQIKKQRRTHRRRTDFLGGLLSVELVNDLMMSGPPFPSAAPVNRK